MHEVWRGISSTLDGTGPKRCSGDYEYPAARLWLAASLGMPREKRGSIDLSLKWTRGRKVWNEPQTRLQRNLEFAADRILREADKPKRKRRRKKT